MDNRPQAAREVLVAVLKTDAEHRREAQELLHEIEHALGIREGRVGMGYVKQPEEFEIRRQEARIEAANLVNRGKACYAAKYYDDCIESMQRVLEIERWSAADVELKGFADQARAYIESARKLAAVEREQRNPEYPHRMRHRK